MRQAERDAAGAADPYTRCEIFREHVASALRNLEDEIQLSIGSAVGLSGDIETLRLRVSRMKRASVAPTDEPSEEEVERAERCYDGAGEFFGCDDNDVMRGDAMRRVLSDFLSRRSERPQGERAAGGREPSDGFCTRYVSGEGRHRVQTDCPLAHGVPCSPETSDAEMELAEIARAIGTVEFMDPPDGGSVTLAEQIRRMREALDDARRVGAEARSTSLDETQTECDDGTCGLCERCVRTTLDDFLGQRRSTPRRRGANDG